MIDKQMQTLEEIMFDTSRRAKAGASCLYLTSDNRKCAVGSMLTDSALDEFAGGVNTLSAQAKGLSKLLRYKCHATQLDYLKGFHDASKNWDENGMTNTGCMNLQDMKTRIKAGDIDEQVRIMEGQTTLIEKLIEFFEYTKEARHNLTRSLK